SLFFLNDPPPTTIYTLSLHDALPISYSLQRSLRMRLMKLRDRVLKNFRDPHMRANVLALAGGKIIGLALVLSAIYAWIGSPLQADRKSTRLNSSHLGISYAVFCLKKK